MHCDLLRKAFESVPHRFQVVASACSTTEILNALEKNRPQVAIISSNLQDEPIAGIRILPRVRQIYPDTRVLVTTGSTNRELVTDAFRFGAHGVFGRNGPFDLLCKSVEVIAQGQIWVNTEELHYILDALAKSSKLLKVDPTVESRLTKRETAAVGLAIQGLSNREIAGQLGLTEHTVKNYLVRVFDKLGVSNRVELVLSCLRQAEDDCEESAARTVLADGKVRTVGKPMTAGRSMTGTEHRLQRKGIF
jgi:DNA-binding NarL/FixJ family response regulator